MCYGPEFAGRMLDHWVYLNGVGPGFPRPGKPIDGAFIGASDVHWRAECLNASWFLSMPDARDRLKRWRCAYDDYRPFSAFGNLTPRAFARQGQTARRVAWRPGRSRGQDQPELSWLTIWTSSGRHG